MFGGKRLEEMLGELDPPSAEAAVRAVTGAVDAFAAGTPQSDDITCLAIGVP
jgi:serine phosphatase RsbU (regulator of sigma subunit)